MVGAREVIMNYGIAIDFFGNYKTEGRAVDNLSNKIHSSLISLQTVLAGSGLIAGLGAFGNKLLSVAKTMEQQFAVLKSTLGSAAKAYEAFAWAKKKGVETPFEITEVNDALTMMTSMGFNKNNEMREKVFQAIGDFAGLKGASFSEMMSAVARASFGNWELVGDRYGIRQQTIGTMAMSQVQRNRGAYTEEDIKRIEKANKVIQAGKKGTEEYKMAIVELFGAIGKGGMENRMNTIAGAWSNVSDIFSNTLMSIVGFTQEQGTLANTIKQTIADKILKPFNQVETVTVNGITKTISMADKLQNVGKGVGEVIKGVWGLIDTQVGESTNIIVQWINKLNKFFSDYKNNVAPLVLFIALIKIQVEEFLKGFISGFKVAFGALFSLAVGIWKVFVGVLKFFGLANSSAEGLGKTLGLVIGLLIGIRAFKIITSPLRILLLEAKSLWVRLLAIKSAILISEGWSLKDSIIFRWWKFKEALKGTFVLVQSGLKSFARFAVIIWSSVIPAISSAAVAAWGFTAALLSNPITWIVVGVVALVAALVLAWNKFAGFRGAIKATWDVVKGFGIILKDFVIDRVVGLVKGLGSIAKAIYYLFTGKFKMAGQAALDGVDGILGISATKKAAASGSALVTSVPDIYNKRIADERAKSTSKKLSASEAKRAKESGGIQHNYQLSNVHISLPNVKDPSNFAKEFEASMAKAVKNQ